MELQDRIVEHLLLPSYEDVLGWGLSNSSDASIFTSAERALAFRQRLLAEYFEYNWAAFVGTGGVLAVGSDWLFEPMGTLDVSESEASTYVQEGNDSSIRTIRDELAAIKASLGLSITQLADALRVRRPTIYSWLDGESGPESLRKANRERLAALSKVAQSWNKLSKHPPGKYLSAAVVGDKSLLDLLTAAALEDTRIQAALTRISQAAGIAGDAKHRTLGQRLRDRGFAQAPSISTQAARNIKKS